MKAPRIGAAVARLGLILALAAGCVATPCAGPPVRVQLLLVNDVYQLGPDGAGRGGLARVATLVRGLRRETPHTLFALAGDTLSPSLYSTMFRGRQMIEAWNALGLDVATFGNHEFDFGPAVLRERMGESRFLWLSTNVRETGGSRAFGGARSVLVKDFGGVRVAAVGLTLADTHHTSKPGSDVVFVPPAVAAQEAFERAGAADLRVAITHLTIAEDRALAAALSLHAILGGHDHDPMVQEAGQTVIVKAGADAVNVGRVEYDLGCGGAVITRRQRLIPVDASIAPAPDVDALVARYAALADRELDQPVGAITREIDARESEVRRVETPIGRFIAEAMRERLGARIGLLNGGAIRGNRLIPPGTVTRRDFRALLPFDNTAAMIEVSGDDVRAALERSVSAWPRPAGMFLQTAGLDYVADADRPVGQRIGRVTVGGAVLEPAGRYTIALPDFLARGGDGYTMLAAGRVLVPPEEGPAIVEVLFEALARGRFP